MDTYQQTIEEVATQFGTTIETGLESKDVAHQRRIFGYNSITEEDAEKWWIVLGRQFTGLLIYILVFAAFMSGILGEWVDTIAIVTILLINGVLGFWQEWKAQANIAALKQMASPMATVIRGGKTQSIPSKELVPGDIIILSEGDKIPADARLIEAVCFATQEGALTGESTAVSKHTDSIQDASSVGDQKNMVFSGTIITRGRGKAIVTSTGMKTQIGHIAHMIQEAETDQTPLQKNLEVLGARIGQGTIGISILIFAIILFKSGAFNLLSVKHAFLLSVSLAVAAIPEGLPIVVTIALAFGTQVMLAKNALIKRLPAVETLGSTTVICSDKTGTLTKNEMTVTSLWHSGTRVAVTGTGYKPEGTIDGAAPPVLFEIAALCNDAHLLEDKNWSIVGDPTEACLLTLARKAGMHEARLLIEQPRIGEIPFSSERKRMSTIHKTKKGTMLYTKGAPDIILAHCSKILENGKVRNLTKSDKTRILKANDTYATRALRVLGFAYKEVEKKKAYGDDDESELIFVALTGMIDPPREEAIAAIRKCTRAGIRVVMITGDHKTTAMAIAKQLGIEGEAITGEEINTINLKKMVNKISVYARVNPEHKMQIVDALKQKGHVVAMTGDGVNDAPALKRSDIGIAMGITGTDVAKDASAMILTDDNFASIVSAIEEGRNIFTNIKKFVNYLLSSNLAEVLVILFSVLLISFRGAPVEALTIPMLLYINLLTDSLPALALGVDPGDKYVMSRKPRNPKEPIITKNMLINIVFIGVLVTVAVVGVFWFSLHTQADLAYARTMALTTIVTLEIVRLAMIRKQYNTPAWSNHWLLLAIGIVLALQLFVIYVPFMQRAFETVALALTDWFIIGAIASMTYIVGMVIGDIISRVTGQHD